MLTIAVSIYKPVPSYLEQKSWERLLQIAGHYPIVLFGPETLDTSWYFTHTPPSSDVTFVSFDSTYFTDLISYSRLLINPLFYRKFLSHEFLLIYQLDAFIFRDELPHWCELGYDYVGAPFFFYYTTIGSKAKYGGVGNGGFSLRKVESLLRVVTTNNKIYSREQIDEQKEGKNFKGKLYYEATYQLGKIGLLNNTKFGLNDFKGYEDYFFGYFAGPKLPWFRFPDYSTAMQFSFEYNCDKLYQENNFQLPMGCHAWWKTDKDFWIPHFLELGIDINAHLINTAK